MAEVPRFRVAFERDLECRTVPASGAIGSPTSDGQLAVQFYVERAAMVQSITVEQQGQLVVQVEQEGGQSIVRRVVAEIVLSPSAASQLRNLIDQIFAGMNIDPKQFEVAAAPGAAKPVSKGQQK